MHVICTSVAFSQDKGYRAYINRYLASYYILGSHGDLVANGIGNSVLDAKKEVRQHLINLGVKFNKERRISNKKMSIQQYETDSKIDVTDE